MSTRNRLLFFATGWLIVLMPFLFWWNTWFGRQLSDKQIVEYLQDDKHPRHIQHALVQIGERIARGDASASNGIHKASAGAYPVEEVRNTDAWVMGQDTSGAGFHEALLKCSTTPRLPCAAMRLYLWCDLATLPGGRRFWNFCKPAKIAAPQEGKVSDTSVGGHSDSPGGNWWPKLQPTGQTIEVRSPISGRVREDAVQTGQNVSPGATVADIDPGTEQVWEALRALYFVGQPEDLAAVLPYERELPDIPDQVRQQAMETEKAIRQRSQ